MKARTFEDRVNAGYYSERPFEDFQRDAKLWLRGHLPTKKNLVSKVFSLAIPEVRLPTIDMMDTLKKYVELFDPVRVELAIDDRDDRVYYASCPEIQPVGAKPETGWTYEEALGSLIMRQPDRFGYLIEKKGRTEMKQ